jgi:gluconokinase
VVTASPRIVIVMGVSGAGKTTVGKALAARLGWPFIEGDDFHPASNVAAMAAGHPLTDADRAPWLAAIRKRIDHILEARGHAVIACSALKHAYRKILVGSDADAVRLVHLRVPLAVLRQRLEHRTAHFMPASLLTSQLATLESSTTALEVDGTKPVTAIVDEVVSAFRLDSNS